MTDLEKQAAESILQRVISSQSSADTVALVDSYCSLKRIAVIPEYGKSVCGGSSLSDALRLAGTLNSADYDANTPIAPDTALGSPEPATTTVQALVETPAAPAKRRGRPPAAASTPAPAPEPEPPVITETVGEPLSEPHPSAAAPEPEAPAVDLDIVGSEPEAKVYTLDDLRAITVATREHLGENKHLYMEPAQAILREFGANQVKDVPEDKAHEIVTRILKLEHLASAEKIAETRKMFGGGK